MSRSATFRSGTFCSRTFRHRTFRSSLFVPGALRRTRRALGLALLASFAIVGAAGAASHAVNTSAGLTAKGAPLALRGYDPVSYFEQGEPMIGEASIAAVHDGATYRFASKNNLARFKKSPERFVPQYGGYCAYGTSVGAKFDGDPQVWRIVDGKLYLNLNRKIQKSWSADVSGAIAKADANWQRIRDAAPETLSP